MQTSRLLLGLLLASALAAAGYYRANTAREIAVVQAQRGPAVQAVYATGAVEPTVMLPLAAQVTARLLALNVDEGDTVKQGQVLAKLEAEALAAALKEAEVRETFAQQELGRITALYRKQAVAQKDYDSAQTNYAVARQQRTAAAAQLEHTRLVAPADGTILRRDGEVGQMIPANTTVFWLACCAPLRISAEVDEEDIALVRQGQPVLIHADAFPGEVFHGSVASITPKGDAVTRSFRVRIDFPASAQWLVGMTTETNIIIQDNPNAWLLPVSAVADSHIWVVVDGRLYRKAVVTGVTGKTQVEIKQGLTGAERVVQTVDASLRQGSKVTAKLVRPTP